MNVTSIMFMCGCIQKGVFGWVFEWGYGCEYEVHWVSLVQVPGIGRITNNSGRIQIGRLNCNMNRNETDC